MPKKKKIPTEYDPNAYKEVRDLYLKGLEIAKTKDYDNLELPEKTVRIDDLDTQSALQRLYDSIVPIVEHTLQTGRPEINVPSRSSGNIVWDEVNDLLLMGEKTSSKQLLTLTSTYDVTRLARVMEIIHELLQKDMHAKKREVFYHDVNLFQDQRHSDGSIEDAAALMHATRNSTHVVASAKGVAIGCLKIRDGTDIIDLEKQGKGGGWSISPFLDDVEILETSAEFILVVEKDAAMSRLAEAKWYKKFPCIILTGKGMADIATRMFLKRLSKLGLPVFVLVDADSYGFSIASVFKQGSKKLSYESPFLATQDVRLLGLLHRDLDAYNIPEEVRIPMTKADIKKAKQLIKEEFIPDSWKKDLKGMIKDGNKAEIQALSSKGFEYLTEEYLPAKLSTGDWL